MTLTAEQRRARILEVVRESGTVRVVDLAAQMGLAAVTVRRDVAALAESGRLRRSHGAVSLPGGEAGAAPEGRAPVVGILVPTVGLYFDEIIAGARAAADAAGARLVLGVSSYRPADDRATVEQLLSSGVDGLLVTPRWTPDAEPGGSAPGGSAPGAGGPGAGGPGAGGPGAGGPRAGGPADDAWLCGLPVPTVLVERQAPPGSPFAQLDAVGSDHGHGVLLALRHLASLGHDAVLLAARTDTWTAHRVRVGYADTVRLLGLKPLPVVDIGSPGGDLDRVVSQLGEEAGVRAVLVHNDQDALQLVPLLRARGLRVPDDVAVVSYDDVVAALGDPPLTAVAPPKHFVGQVALELLLTRVAETEPSPVRHVALLPELKVRTSCGGAAG